MEGVGRRGKEDVKKGRVEGEIDRQTEIEIYKRVSSKKKKKKKTGK